MTHTELTNKYKLESRKVFARAKTVAGSNDYFGNLVIFKIYEFNSVRFTVIYKSGVAIFYHKGNYKLTNARTYLLYDQRSAPLFQRASYNYS